MDKKLTELRRKNAKLHQQLLPNSVQGSKKGGINVKTIPSNVNQSQWTLNNTSQHNKSRMTSQEPRRSVHSRLQSSAVHRHSRSKPSTKRISKFPKNLEVPGPSISHSPSIKPHFLANIQPIEKPKSKSFFRGWMKPFAFKKAKQEREVPQVVIVKSQSLKDPDQDLQTEINASNPETKCAGTKTWLRDKKNCCLAPFKACTNRILESQKLTCFLLILVIAIVVIVCLMIIIFPVVEFFYKYKDE